MTSTAHLQKEIKMFSKAHAVAHAVGAGLVRTSVKIWITLSTLKCWEKAISVMALVTIGVKGVQLDSLTS